MQLLEPNIKESPGGLRDIQALEWAMKSQTQQADATSLWSHYLESGDVEAVERSRAFLWRVRHHMHFAVGRKRDVLEQELKMQIAESFGYRDQGMSWASSALCTITTTRARYSIWLIWRLSD